MDIEPNEEEMQKFKDLLLNSSEVDKAKVEEKYAKLLKELNETKGRILNIHKKQINNMKYKSFLKSSSSGKSSIDNSVASAYTKPIKDGEFGETSSRNNNMECRCGSGKKYKKCCKIRG
jgi:uncharacterized protein YchJ